MSRKPLLHEPPLLSPERAIRLAEEATAAFRTPRTDDEEDFWLARVRFGLLFDAALLALETAIDTGDPRVLAAGLELATESVGVDHDPVDYAVAQAARVTLPAAPAITNTVRDCARSRSSSLRAATATGLGPRALRSMQGEGDEVDEEAAGIVFKLASDADSDVRKSAREALGGAAPPAWATFFPRDPLASRPAHEAAALRGPLDRAGEALEGRIHRDATPLVEAIAELPDDLATPILEAWLREPLALRAESAEPLIERWLTIDADATRTIEWLRAIGRDGGMSGGERLAAVLAGRPSAEVERFCLPIAAERIRLSAREQYRAENVADAILAVWPADADPMPLLELALGVPLEEAAGAPEPDHDAGRNRLFKLALAPERSLGAALEALVAAFVDGCPGAWTPARTGIAERLITVRHPRLRAYAEAQLRDEEGSRVAWALRYLTGGGHEPDRDPPPAEILRSAARDPRLRAVMLRDASLRSAVHEDYRGALVAGELPAAEVMDLAISLRKANVELEPAEWTEVRRAREQLEHPLRALLALPGDDAWTDDDRVFVHAVLEARRDDRGLGPMLSQVLFKRPPEALVSLIQDWVVSAPDPLRPMVESFLALINREVDR